MKHLLNLINLRFLGEKETGDGAGGGGNNPEKETGDSPEKEEKTDPSKGNEPDDKDKKLAEAEKKLAEANKKLDETEKQIREDERKKMTDKQKEEADRAELKADKQKFTVEKLTVHSQKSLNEKEIDLEWASCIHITHEMKEADVESQVNKLEALLKKNRESIIKEIQADNPSVDTGGKSEELDFYKTAGEAEAKKNKVDDW